MSENIPLADVHPPHPVQKPLMLQNWESLTFLHWRYDPKAMQALLPPGLKVDVFEGTAWVGLIPFRITKLRAPHLPSLPLMSSFPETNVRTYVRGPGGERGIWFFTLEAARLLAVVSARTFYGLPYRWADMRVQAAGDTVHYASRRCRLWTPAHTRITIRIGESVSTSDLESFLTARFRLYATIGGKLAFADVEHAPWSLRKAEILHMDQTLVESCGLPGVNGEPIAHYSEDIHARIGRPRWAASESLGDVGAPR